MYIRVPVTIFWPSFISKGIIKGISLYIYLAFDFNLLKGILIIIRILDIFERLMIRLRMNQT